MDGIGVGRRSFLKLTAAAAAGVSLAGSAAAQAPAPRAWHKALKIGMLPNLPDAEKFALAKRCGWEGIDGSPMDDLDAARAQAQAAKDAGVTIHGLVSGAGTRLSRRRTRR